MYHAVYIETYLHFSKVITVGSFSLETGELSYLFHKGLIEQEQKDSIGKVYGFTQKFKNRFD